MRLLQLISHWRCQFVNNFRCVSGFEFRPLNVRIIVISSAMIYFTILSKYFFTFFHAAISYDENNSITHMSRLTFFGHTIQLQALKSFNSNRRTLQLTYRFIRPITQWIMSVYGISQLSDSLFNVKLFRQTFFSFYLYEVTKQPKYSYFSTIFLLTVPH